MKKYWNEQIKIEVMLPYITQGCTLGHLKAEITIYNDMIWCFGDNSLTWKASTHYGDEHLLFVGKCEPRIEDGHIVAYPTTHKIEVHNTHDGIRPGREQYKAIVIAAA